MRAAARTLTTHAHRAQKQIAKLPSLQRSVEVGRLACDRQVPRNARSVFYPPVAMATLMHSAGNRKQRPPNAGD